MFESEDFDLDEGFLKDIGQKEEEYYSQKIETEANQPAKRRKTESLNFDLLSDITFDDEPDFARVTKKSVEPSLATGEHLSLEKTIIPEIFEMGNGESSHSQKKTKNSSLCENPTKNSQTLSKIKCNENVEISRKMLAIEILKKGLGSCDKGRMEEKKSNSSWPRSGPLRPISSDGERNPRIDNSNEETRRKSLLETFKKPAPRPLKSPAKYGQKVSPKFSSRDRSIAAPRVTLIRQFPGPAGLLPDSSDVNLDCSNLINRLDDCNPEMNEDRDDSGTSEYFSQNTERLFSGGAWRMMLDDLPADFLRGHEISTIKRTRRNNARVPFLAGVIQRIDHSLENPRLVLKDLSDSIEGTMHGDIPLAHPNVLEPGVVVLLRNVGLLGFSANFPNLHFHVMIAPGNILAVYNEKSRLVTSPWMESLLTSAEKPERGSTTSPTISKSPTSSRGTKTTGGELESAKNSLIAENNIDISDFESDEDDGAFAHFDIAELGDSQVAANFSKLPSKIDTKTVGKSLNIAASGETISRLEDTPTGGTRVPDKAKERSRDERIGERPSETSIAVEIEMKPKKITSVTSRLLQFRSKDVLTPQIRKEETVDTSATSDKHIDTPTEDSENKNDSNLKGLFEDLLDNDNDTDDEILSQLDVDSIVTSYNSAT